MPEPLKGIAIHLLIALLYILGPPLVFFGLIFALNLISPLLAWGLIGASWYWVLQRH